MREEGQEQRLDTARGQGSWGASTGRAGVQDRPHQELLPTPQARASQLDRSLELPGALGPGLLGEGPGSVSEEKEMPALPGFPGAAPDLEDWIS